MSNSGGRAAARQAVRRWATIVSALALAAGCGGPSGESGGDDPLGLPTSTSTSASTAAAAPGAQPTGYGAPTTLGVLSDPDIPESSGLAASRKNPGLLWTHNDSGDGPYVYCLTAQIRSCGVWRVTGAEAFDWEDMAVGPGPRAGEPYLYLGDIGDNLAQRQEIVVYRVPEPTVGGDGGRTVSTKSSPAATAPTERIRLRYPDGAQDAEALLVHPMTGDLYILTKHSSGAIVYRASAPLDTTGVTSLTNVGTVRVGSGLRALDVVTGGDIAPDGRRVALSTYRSGYELVLPPGVDRFDAIWTESPNPVALGPRLQGESIAYSLDGRALLSSSEMVPSPIQQVERR